MQGIFFHKKIYIQGLLSHINIKWGTTFLRLFANTSMLKQGDQPDKFKALYCLLPIELKVSKNKDYHPLIYSIIKNF